MANNEEIVNNEQVVEEVVATAEAPVEAKAQKVKGQRTYEKKEVLKNLKLVEKTANLTRNLLK